MSSEPARIMTCPNCKQRMRWRTDNPYRPFCSERCQLIDFGAWANEEHRISGKADADEVMSGDVPQQP